MTRSWDKERGHAITGLGGHGWTARISWLLGVIFAIIGVIGELMDTTLVLKSMSWYLLSIAAFASGIVNIVPWAIGLYLHARESKK